MASRKSIFVTGSASGIGRAIARKFADEGWFVGLGDVNEDGMAQTQALLSNGFNYAQKLDVRQRDQWDDALKAFHTAAGGRIDVVANNAGIPLGGPLAECSEDEITRTLDINLKGMIFGAQAALPYLMETAPGSALVNTASAAGIYGTGGASVYSATKFGVRGLTESLDAEWAPLQIKVRSLCPSFIDTPLLDMQPNAKSNENIGQRVRGAGLEITPVEDVAQAAWDAVHGSATHVLVGKTAKQIAFAARWMPGKVRARARKTAEAGGGPLGR